MADLLKRAGQSVGNKVSKRHSKTVNINDGHLPPLPTGPSTENLDSPTMSPDSNTSSPIQQKMSPTRQFRHKKNQSFDYGMKLKDARDIREPVTRKDDEKVEERKKMMKFDFETRLDLLSSQNKVDDQLLCPIEEEVVVEVVERSIEQPEAPPNAPQNVVDALEFFEQNYVIVKRQATTDNSKAYKIDTAALPTASVVNVVMDEDAEGVRSGSAEKNSKKTRT
eukprot:TRINITY_DN25742_c0_g1_i1.p1 TRINITY_DN25742_c0_g1~~TRINITY_DN25742_c0_g1_i1.p1  ORF type:complete len:223 (+),score=55.68 TRINITY_DN25742_c0_g1_i1:59-727(+)